MKCKFLTCLLLFGYIIQAQHITIDLKSTWQFRKAGDAEWMKANVPGTVHTDLLAVKKIPDPFYRDNELKVQWINTEDWDYQTFFDSDNRTLSKMNVRMIFNGLDTYADVYLNGQHILTADNMFRTWSADVKRLLRLKNNHLIIRFHSAQKKIDSFATAMLPLVLPDHPRVYVRKAQYHFGWDWGPKFTTCGIWKNIQLQAWDEVQIEDIYVRGITIDTLSDGNDIITRAKVTTEVTINSETDKVYNLLLSDASRNSPNANTRPAIFTEFFERMLVKKGTHTYTLVIVMRNPELWWPNGYGKPVTYRISCALFDGADTRTSPETVKEKNFAIRTVELIQQPDSSSLSLIQDPRLKAQNGRGFYFSVNGIPIFAKGANYIPMSPFLSSVNKEDYRAAISHARSANMNMLRVWGGGVYEKDEFYDLCDDNGLMVWQDLMFAGAMYPGDEKFLGNVKAEIEEQVKRLRNHPSVVLWCGNNENDEAWHNWGWQRQYNLHGQDSAKIWQWYKQLFHELAPSVIKELDPYTPYWPSSPSFGWGRKESYRQGDSHYWGVWHGSLEGFDIETIKEYTGRFVSEYGMQSLPAWQTIERFTLPNDRDTASPVMKVHQKNPPGYYKLGSYLGRYFRPENNFERYAYLTQCLQAYTMKYAIETHRSKIPWCMGTLYWQLNDCWPVTSWSTVDGYGNWKAAHYIVREAYKPLLTGMEQEGTTYKIYAVNDGRYPATQTIKASLLDFAGNTGWQKTVGVTLEPNEKKYLLSVDSSELFRRFPDTASVMQLAIPDSVSAGKFVTANLAYFVRPKALALTTPRITVRQLDATHVEVSTDVLARYVWLHIPNTSYHFSDNFFDLLPGERKIVEVKTGKRIKKLAKFIRVRSLAG